MNKQASRFSLLLALWSWGLSADALWAQDPFGPRITATRWVLAHGRESSLRSVGLRSQDNPRGRNVPGAQAIFNRINGFNGVQGFPNPRAITLSVNQAGSLFEMRPVLIGPSGAVIPDPNRPTLPRQLVLAAARLDGGMTLVVAEMPTGVGFRDWHALTSRFGAGNYYATVSMPAVGIVAGQELITHAQLKAYTANSIIFEAPAFGNVVVRHGLSGGTSRVTAHTTAKANGGLMTRGFGWAQPLELIVAQEGEPRFLDNGRVVLNMRAELPNSFVAPAPAAPRVTIRWAAESNAGTVIRDAVVLAPRESQGTLKRVARFQVELRGVKEGEMVKITAVASPGRLPFVTPVMSRTSQGQRPVRQAVGLTTFHSARSTLEDTLSVRIGKQTESPGVTGTLEMAMGDKSTVMYLRNWRSFPTDNGPFDVRIGNEQIRVYGKGSGGASWTIFTVERGINGTTPAAHAKGAMVVLATRGPAIASTQRTLKK